MPNNNVFDPLDFGGADDSHIMAAEDAARQAGGAIVLAPGIDYQCSHTINLNWQYASIGGAVPGVRSKLTYTAKDGDVIRMQGKQGFLHLSVHDLHIESADALCPDGRPTAATRTGRGVVQDGFLGRSSVSNLFIARQFIGLQLDSTEYSVANDIRTEVCVSHGIFMYATSANPLQWYWSGQNITQDNGGDGFHMAIDPVNGIGAGVMSSGDICNLSTWYNRGHAVAFYGLPNCPLASVRWRGGFVGGDCDDLIYLDTYGTEHHISGVYGELGMRRGVYLTANNRKVSMTDVAMHGMVLSGFAIMGDDVSMVNCSAISNGRQDAGQPLSPNPYGFYLGGHRAQLIGGHSGNEPGSQYQNYGVINAIPLNGNGTQNKQFVVGHNAFGNNIADYLGAFEESSSA